MTQDRAVAAIAVTGIACRFPRAGSPRELWSLLREGTSAVREVPGDRWAVPPDGEAAARFGAFLDGVDLFDPGFFGISPREAALMDPQQRLMLELAWEALEDAATLPSSLDGTPTGVFVGAIAGDYAQLLQRHGSAGITRHALTGLQRSVIANRVSYALGLRGPSLTVDTGQSSALVAVHLACESLRRGESALALAGGVSLNLIAESAIAAARFGGLSPDGRCFTFDARANGYVRGEGGGLVALKLLDRALADGDPVHCVIRGSATNNDGGGEGLTVPSAAAQAEVLLAACQQAGLRGEDLQYVELHGTGTRRGDPIEAAALGAAFGAVRPPGDPLRVGSVKTNIGHLEGAAGIAGLIKAILAIEHGEIPASLNFEQPNPEIPLDELGLRVQAECGGWPHEDRPLTAGVSSFGVGGTNCHVVLGQGPEVPSRAPRGNRDAGRPAVAPWVLSARSEPSLREQAERLRAHLAAAPELDAVDVGLSLATTRTAFEHRAVAIGDRAELLASLDGLVAGQPTPRTITGRASAGGGPVFFFPGQGAQWPGMALDLIADAPEFAAQMRACEEALSPFVDWSFDAVLRAGSGAPSLDRLDVVQPLLFAVMVSLAELWRSHGVEPSAVVGHSQGEVAAAYVAGGLSLDDAARVVASRSRALKRIAGRGGMAAVALSAGELTDRLAEYGGRLGLAARNGSSSVVVSGDPVALSAFLERCAEDGVRAREVAVDYAGHSAQVDEVRDELLDSLASIAPESGRIPFHSTVTGGLLDTAELDANYWFRNARQPVLLEPVTRALLDDGQRLLLEVSPHPVLSIALEETVDAAIGDPDDHVAILSTLGRGEGGLERFTRSLAKLYVNGGQVDWSTLFDNPSGHRAPLPTYPFQRDRYWFDVEDTAVPRVAASGALATRLARMPERERERVVLDLVRTEAAAVLGHSAADSIPPRAPFKDLGFDSPAAVELRNRLRTATGLPLPATVVFNRSTSAALAAFLTAEATGVGDGERVAAAAVSAAEPIAIVGIGCRFPGGIGSPEQFWDLVAGARDAIGELPRDRGWDVDRLYDPDADQRGTSYASTGGFVDGATEFDAAFFGIGPREAQAMDPQQRLLLEVSWEALEHAGIDPSSLAGSGTGVFAGVSGQDYGATLRGREELEGYRLTGGATSVASGRVAYLLGLEGPAVTVDTACSSSLVAMHLACQSLRQGECSLALSGGATVMSTPDMFVEFSRYGGLARDGRCKSFADAADGTGWAEGVGVVALERLSDARRNGREVLAIVRGSAINQDGASNGLTAPSGLAQERVIRQALANAGLSPADVDAVEAHGTGTTLGDPIEAEALLATYGRDRSDGPLRLGSVKSNIGHAQAAAGVAGVIKTVLAMRNELLPATLHVDEPSRHVDWSAGGVELLAEPVEWAPSERPRRAGVSSFGISGTNAHLLLEEPPATTAGLGSADGVDGVDGGGAVVPWVLSARSGPALAAVAQRLAGHVEGRPELRPLDVGWSLATGRAGLEARAVVVGEGRDEFLAGLGELAGDGPGPEAAAGRADAGDVIFVFPGQGSQWLGMAGGLLASSSTFAEEISRCEQALAGYVDWSLTDVLTSEDESWLGSVDVVQPALWAVMVSLAGLWRASGIEPSGVIGHSQGEIAAACVAGALSLEDGARVVTARSQALVALVGAGGMVSVGLGVDEVRLLVAEWEGRLSVAAVNGPVSVVVSGDAEALDELLERSSADGFSARRVAVDYASHSAQTEAVRDGLVDALDAIAPRTGAVPFHSTVTGGLLDGADLDADYWYRNLRETVQLQQVVTGLVERGAGALVEVSPHPVLAAGLRDTADLASGEPDRVAVIGTLRRDDGGPKRFLTSLGEAWSHGLDVDWPSVFASSGARKVGLPTYPFERQRHWPEPAASAGDLAAAGQASAGHPLLGAAVAVAGSGGVLLTGRISLATHPWLGDHAVFGTALLPGTGFVELALRAAREAGCDAVEELTLEAPLLLDSAGAVQLQVSVGGLDESGRRELTIHSRSDASDGEHESWVRHASGTLIVDAPVEAVRDGLGTTWPPPGAEAIDVELLYDRLGERGFDYGPAFQGVRTAWRQGDEVLAEIALDDQQAMAAGRYGIHPALLDAAFHALLGVTELADGDERPDALPLPFAWRGIRLDNAGAATVRVRLAPVDGGTHLSMVDLNGEPVLSLGAVAMRPIGHAQLQASARGGGDSLFRLEWMPAPAPAGGEVRIAQLGDLAGFDGEAERYADADALADALGRGAPVPDVVLAGCGGSGGEDAGAEAGRATHRALRLLQKWIADERLVQARLVFVSTRAVAVGEAGPVDLAAAAVHGLVRSAQSEHPGRFGLLDSDGVAASWSALPAALAAEDEPQIALREGAMWVQRLRRAGEGDDAPLVPPETGGWRLAVERRGSFDGLALAPSTTAQHPLAPGEVRVEMRAMGLNFRDVMVTLGMVTLAPEQGDAPVCGEGAGVVLEAGPGVSHLAVGDRVMGLMTDAGGPVAVADARLLVRMPVGWSFAEAAAAPIAFLTAYYGLVDVARLQAGESVLIHAAAGGVGMAAVQLAHHLGAEVFATASPPKWDVVRALGVADDRIASSRTGGFREAFLAASGGAGVDIVLDSLAREVVDASLELLPRGGRFVELGKTDVRDADQVAADHPGVRYRAFDLLEAACPERLHELLAELAGMFESGALTRLPVTAWDVRRAPAAFRHLSQARHVGKVVLTIQRTLDPDGTVLVTGGTGALGALVARHLARVHGVRRMVLTSRRGLEADGATELAEELEQLGCATRVEACNVADRERLAAVLDGLDRPLTAVFHAAGVLDDATIESLSDEGLDRVLAPKVAGVLNLHELTRDLDLAELVSFSSVASALGNPGQGNYAAANAFLAALAQARQADGLPATSLDWGLWARDTALTGGLDERDRGRLTRLGIVPLSDEDGLALLDAARGSGEPALVPVALDVAVLREQAAAGTLPAILRGLVRAPARRERSSASSLAGLAGDERDAALLELVRAQVAAVLGHGSPNAVEAGRAFSDLGLDSLGAVELRNRVGQVTGLRLSSTLAFDHPTAAAVALHVGSQLVGPPKQPAIRAQLDELEGVLGSIATDDERRAVDRRLRSLLAGLAGESPGGPIDPSADRIQAATVDELFELVDQELGEP